MYFQLFWMFSMESGNVNKERDGRKHLIGTQEMCFGFMLLPSR